MSRWRLIAIWRRCLLLVVVWLCACSPSLKNVRVFADGLVATRALPEPIAHDVYESCMRSERYGLLYNQTLGVADAAQIYAHGVSVCAPASSFGPSYAAFHAQIVAYGKALQELTADEAVSYDTVMGELVAATDQSVQAASGQTLDQLVRPGVAQASGKLLAVVTKWSVDGYRRSQVRQAISEASPHVAIILSGLSRMISELYLPGLAAEEGRASRLFALLEKAQKSQTALADLEWRQVQLDLAERRHHAVELLELLTALSTANQKLLTLANGEGAGIEGDKLFAELKPLLKDLVGVAREFGSVAWNSAPAAGSTLHAPAPVPSERPTPTTPQPAPAPPG